MKLTDARNIHPTINPSYSPNLYKWCMDQRPQHFPLFAFKDSDGDIWIGYIDHGYENSACGFVGAKLSAILCHGKKASRGWYTNLGGGNLSEIADFWAQYADRGRCYLDPAHQQYYIDARFAEHGSKRTCMWCGHVQHKQERTRTETYHVWVSDADSATIPTSSTTE